MKGRRSNFRIKGVIRLMKNRESASKSRKKRKVIFESLKNDISALSTERDSIKSQVQKYVELLEKTYADNESLRSHIDSLTDENSKLKDSIMQMQQLFSQSQQSIYAIMLQQKSCFPTPQIMANPSILPNDGMHKQQ